MAFFKSFGGRYRWASRRDELTWGLSLLGFVVLGGYLAYATYGEARFLARPMPPTPKEVSRDVVVKMSKDADGRRASFRILLFSDQFRWRLSSAETLDTETGRPQFSDGMKKVLNDAREIICVGASSEEIPSGVSFESGRAAEERRAARRAARIAQWVSEALTRPIPVRKLNIGHHVPTGTARSTAEQRRVVIILVLDHDPNTNLDQALREAMELESPRAPIFHALLKFYSLASKPTFEWVP